MGKIDIYIYEILRSFPRLRSFIKRLYQVVMYSFCKAKSLFNTSEPDLLQAESVADKGELCFFGYYDKCPWDTSNNYLLCLKVPFDNRMPEPHEAAEICFFNSTTEKKLKKIGETRSWCWQQGCMLQWLTNNLERLIIYNDFQNGKYISVISDLSGAKKKILPLPVYAVSKDGKQAVSLNFGRLHHGRIGYGYIAREYLDSDKLHPADDGIWHINLETGKYQLIISLDEIVNFYPKRDFESSFHYFNHLEFNPSGKRFVFLHRWFKRGKNNSRGQHFTRMFTANSDGSDLYLLADYGMASHFTWKDDSHLLAWANHSKAGCRYYLFKDQSENLAVIGKDILTEDGHPSYSPDKRWILTDTYPNAQRLRTLILFDTKTSKRYDLGHYFAPFRFDGCLRCDLHPRWSHDGKSICFDSVHAGIRNMYTLHVSDFISEYENDTKIS